MRMKPLTFATLFACSAVFMFGGVVSKHGRMQVDGNRIVGHDGKPVVVHGMSHFWSQWEGEFYTRETVDWLVKDWNVSLVRAALGVHDGDLGYQQQPAKELGKIIRVVDAAIANDVYVLIDWHDHHAEKNVDDAVAFFGRMAEMYGDNPHVIYEIYNEPLKVSWSKVVKPYAERVIAAIRQHDPDNLIVVGTPYWSQRVDEAAADPIDDPNVAYVLHFYAATHKAELRARAEKALAQGVALMVTEWGTVEATGDGAIDYESVAEWREFMQKHQLSSATWAVSNKDEGAGIIKPHVRKVSGWKPDELTEHGNFMRRLLRGE
ncbi:MAG: hypothetical protein SynsKO_18670 [Synoicihabitans sp.]